MDNDKAAYLIIIGIALLVGSVVGYSTYWIVVAENDKAQDCVKQRELFLGDNNTSGITEKYINGIDKECMIRK